MQRFGEEMPDGLVVLRINDVVMCELRDHDPKRPRDGLIGLQVHVGPPMVVRFKDLRIRVIRGREGG